MVEDWPLVKSVQGSDYSLFSVRIDTARSPRTGKNRDFYVIDTMDWVTMVPVTPASEVVMVKQFRHGIKETTLETPGGLVERGCGHKQSVERELLEETGYRAREVSLLGELYPQPALFNNHYLVYLGKGVESVAQPCQDEGEDLDVVLVPLRDIKEMIRVGGIKHALVLAAFQLFFLDDEKRKSF
ncbi:MAG: NUDIX domain-containing protein [Proteobacteria bacterium]|nr:NUDIX domain-containing protein [Pseudomonadota bacterium]